MPAATTPSTSAAGAAEATELSALIAAVAAGDRVAFRRLYDAQAARLYGVALRITRHSALASDAVHDAFLQVWRNAIRFEPERGDAGVWLLSLVRYRALDIMRHRSREVADDDIPEQVDADPDPLARLEAGREASALRLCLERLEPERRRIILRAFVDGLSHVELAEQERMPLGTVKSWIRRGLQTLRACLEGAR
jgi:RNA polymerase sigma-70 factor (ECF subfamily)